MPKREVTSDGLRKPPGVFSQATIIEASGRLLSFPARPADGTIRGSATSQHRPARCART